MKHCPYQKAEDQVPDLALDMFTRPRAAIFSILVVGICIGVPLWWKTTAVYRRPLPYEQILKLSNVCVCVCVNVLFDDLSTIVQYLLLVLQIPPAITYHVTVVTNSRLFVVEQIEQKLRKSGVMHDHA